MTYASRKSWISLGLGSSSSLTSPVSTSSSSMISLHRSMHSSQMYTPGPAISFLTCFWLFPQNEHFSRSPPSPMRATHILLCRAGLQPASHYPREPRRYRLSGPDCGLRTAPPASRRFSRLRRPYLGLALEHRQNFID